MHQKTGRLLFYGDLITLVGSAVAAVYFWNAGDMLFANACAISAAVSLILVVFQPVPRLQNYLLKKKALQELQGQVK